MSTAQEVMFFADTSNEVVGSGVRAMAASGCVVLDIRILPAANVPVGVAR